MANFVCVEPPSPCSKVVVAINSERKVIKAGARRIEPIARVRCVLIEVYAK